MNVHGCDVKSIMDAEMRRLDGVIQTAMLACKYEKEDKRTRQQKQEELVQKYNGHLVVNRR